MADPLATPDPESADTAGVSDADRTSPPSDTQRTPILIFLAAVV
jgi:hypothetical protein